MTTLKRQLLFLCIIALLGLTACQPKNEQEETLTIGILSNLDAIPVIIAQNNGYFPKNITYSLFPSAQERDSAFQSGALDGILADVLAACFSYNGGEKVYITGLTDGRFALVAGKASGITDIAEMAGKSVAISENTIIEFTLDQMLTKLGGVPVEKMPIAKIAQRLEMLNQGLVDAALFPEPFVTSSLLDDAVLLQSAEDLGLISGVMIFSEAALNNKPDAVNSFYTAYNKAADYINTTDRSAFFDSIMETLAFPENVRDTLQLPTYQPVTVPSEEIIDQAVAWLLEKGLIEKEITYSQIVRAAEGTK